MSVRRKGNKSCCCGGCGSPPTDWVLLDSDNDGDFCDEAQRLQTQQVYCCGCNPNRACVSIQCENETEVTKEFLLDCSRGTFPILYSGEIPINDAFIDLEFRYSIDESNVCRIVVSSTALGITDQTAEGGGVIDATARADPNRFCSTLGFFDEETQTTFTEWLVDWDSCTDATGTGPGQLSIKLSAPAYADIIDRTDCLVTTGTGTGTETVVRRDVDEIGNLCGGCRCICSDICIEVIHTTATTETIDILPVSRTGLVWRTDAVNTGTGDDSYEISIVKEDTTSTGTGTGTGTVGVCEDDPAENTGCCELSLTESAGFVFVTQPPNVAIGSRTAENKCPDPTATFSGSNSVGDTLSVTFRCQGCEGCKLIETTSANCGCNALIPRELTATITANNCSCAEITLPLIFTGVQQDVNIKWEGHHPDLFCPDTAPTDGEITLLLDCDGAGNFQITLSTNCPGIGEVIALNEEGPGTGTGTEATNTCDPFSKTFIFELVEVDECCGLPPDFVNEAFQNVWVLTILVTE